MKASLVLGLPRGGVVVASEVARELRIPLDILLVRKIGHPLHREFAVGALGEGGVVVLDDGIIGNNAIIRAQLAEIIEEEKNRLHSYQSRFPRAGVPLLDNSVLVVDDGLATGSTTEAAVLSARRRGARQITVAAPVASVNAVERLQRVADAVVVICVDPDFDAVGRYYEQFSQTTDEEVVDLLKAA